MPGDFHSECEALTEARAWMARIDAGATRGLRVTPRAVSLGIEDCRRFDLRVRVRQSSK